MEDAIYDPTTFFKNTVQDEWITDSLSVEMILDVDKSKVVGPHVIDSPVLGGIPPERLSGGVQTLILINNVPDKVFNASGCGDNCAKWLLKIALNKDITINLRHLMHFGDGKFKIHILNNDSYAENEEQLIYIASDFVR